MDNGSMDKKIECGQENLSVLSVSVSVECGVWTVDYDSAVSGEPPTPSLSMVNILFERLPCLSSTSKFQYA